MRSNLAKLASMAQKPKTTSTIFSSLCVQKGLGVLHLSFLFSLQKHAYSNISRILPPKMKIPR